MDLPGLDRPVRKVEKEMTMSMNRRALWLVEAILAHSHERKVLLHLIEGGGRSIHRIVARARYRRL